MANGGWVATYEDVTERELHLITLQRQEEELRIQNLRFDAALNNMSHGLCMFDGDRRLIVCNKRYAEMYGLHAGAGAARSAATTTSSSTASRRALPEERA